MNLRKTLCSLFFIAVTVFKAYAHEPNHSYIFLRIAQDKIEGRFEIGRLDLNKALGLSLSEELDQSELDPNIPAIKSFILSKVRFGANRGQFDLKLSTVDFMNLDDEDDNVRIYFELSQLSEIPKELTINYEPFFDQFSSHKGVLIIEYNWKAGIINNHTLIAEVFTMSDTEKTLDLEDVSLWKGFVAMTKLGVWHIWIGIDHILFLVALVLPAVVRRRNEGELELLEYPESVNTVWKPVAKFRPAALYILKIVTFFTIAHSLTLAIASLNIFTLPSKYVESIIAFSIALAAVHNITPIFKGKEWVIAFVFGLFHGFGFASVLGEKGLEGDYIILSLLGFNVGVEIGQVVIIALVFPLLFLIRTIRFYPAILKYGSVLLILISIQWCIERLFEVNLPIVRMISDLF